jgi:uncharacterized Zn finger protein
MLSDRIPIKIGCPRCAHSVEITLATLQTSTTLTCIRCGKMHVPDKDAVAIDVARQELASNADRPA